MYIVAGKVQDDHLHERGEDDLGGIVYCICLKEESYLTAYYRWRWPLLEVMSANASQE